MKHALFTLAIMAIDHWIANEERIAATSLLGLIFRIFESTILGVKKILLKE